MPNLIDTTYFIRDLNLVNTDTVTNAALQQDIDFYEPEYFSKVWNRELYEAFIANPTEQRFIDLKEGKSYEFGGNTYYWRGLLNTTMKSSPIANYVYVKHVNNRAVVMSGVGATVNTAENATRVSPAERTAPAWQAMVEVNREMYDYLSRNSSVYPEFSTSVFWAESQSWPRRCRVPNPMYNPAFINRVF